MASLFHFLASYFVLSFFFFCLKKIVIHFLPKFIFDYFPSLIRTWDSNPPRFFHRSVLWVLFHYIFMILFVVLRKQKYNAQKRKEKITSKKKGEKENRLQLYRTSQRPPNSKQENRKTKKKHELNFSSERGPYRHSSCQSFHSWLEHFLIPSPVSFTFRFESVSFFFLHFHRNLYTPFYIHCVWI